MMAPTPEHSASIIAVPTMPPWLMSLAARARPASAIAGSSVEVAAQPCRRRVGGGFPVGERLAIAAAQVDRGNQLVAGLRVEAGEQTLGAAEDRDRELAAIAARVGVAADDRHAECLRGRAQARPATGAASSSPADQTASTTASGRPPIAATSEMLTMTPHQPANHGSRGDELVDEAFDREQQESVAVGNGGAVVADRNRARAGQSELRRDRGDVVLGGKPAACPQRGRKRTDCDRTQHHAAFFGSDRKPVSASANGG